MRKGERRPGGASGRKGAPRRPARPKGGAAALAPEDLVAAFEISPVAAALLEEGRVRRANQAFARAVGLEPAACAGRPILELLPPEGEPPALPGPGRSSAFRSRLGGVGARADVRGLERAGGGKPLALLVLSLHAEDVDTAQSRALLELSRELAQSRGEEEIAGALSRALEVLFPGRAFCIRLVDAKSLALTTLYARGRLKPIAQEQVLLRRLAVRREGLSEAALGAGGVGLVEEDEPVFQGCVKAIAVPVAVGGSLFGVVNLEYPPGGPGEPKADEPLLLQVANQAALGVRNLRSIEELTFLKTYLEELIENANALIVVTNRQGEMLVFNRALSRLTGVGREEALGGELLSLLPPEERGRARRVLERSIEGEAVTSFETRLALRGGGEAQVVVNTAPITGHTGEVEGVIAIGQDLTALRAMEERAEHYQRLAGFGRLAAGIVHELNNPLVAIVTYSDSLLSRYRLGGLDPNDVEKLRRIQEAGERIQRFSRDLIAYARPSTDKPEDVDVAGLLEQAARMCEPVLREAKAKAHLEIAPAPRVRGGRASLLQVFVNLVTNAAQAVRPEGGNVTLGIATRGDRVVATVADDGTGMTDEVRSRVFEPFFTTKQGGRGAGLGLSIVQGIVARHGGVIEVRSIPGAGTTFTVTLPIRGSEAPAVRPPPAPG
ncbi:MAG TPA: ATP-binding protein [Anaeromyxobacteraceae bacterium]|nr:ATP-binding protein [Anaeromyxobacteraceae bacterium]